MQRFGGVRAEKTRTCDNTMVLAPPPRIETDSIQRLADGGLQFRVSGPSGVPLIVQGSIDFSEWVGLQTNTVGGVFDFTDGDALLPWRFYRALAQ